MSGEDTIEEYKKSNHKDVVNWVMRMCHDGKCLDEIDWACGFTNGDQFEVNDCFIDTAEKTQNWVTLDAVRKYCGKKSAVLTARYKYDPNYPSESECNKEGGTWKRIKDIPKIPLVVN